MKSAFATGLIAGAFAIVAGLVVELSQVDRSASHASLGGWLGVETLLGSVAALMAGLVSGALLVSGRAQRRLRALAEAGWVLAGLLLASLLVGALTALESASGWVGGLVSVPGDDYLILGVRAGALLVTVAILSQAAARGLPHPSRCAGLPAVLLASLAVSGPGLFDAADLYRPRDVPALTIEAGGDVEGGGPTWRYTQADIRRATPVAVRRAFAREGAVRIDLRSAVSSRAGEQRNAWVLPAGGRKLEVSAVFDRCGRLILIPDDDAGWVELRWIMGWEG